MSCVPRMPSITFITESRQGRHDLVLHGGLRVASSSDT